MSHSFSVDLLSLNRPQYKPTMPAKVTREELQEKAYQKETNSFLFIDAAQNWMSRYETKSLCDELQKWWQGHQTSGKHWVQFLETTSKVISVVQVLIGMLLPLACFYLPAWVPWGIGLPSFLLLGYAQSKLRGKISNCKIDMEYVPFFREMIKHQSYRSLHPFGSWDLPESDPRLKSDSIAKHVPRQSAAGIEEVIGSKSRPNLSKGHDLPDLEMTPAVQLYAAAEFAHAPFCAEKRGKLREAWVEVQKACREQSHPLFEEKLENMRTLLMDKNPILEVLSCKEKDRDYAWSMVLLYHSFCKLFKEAKRLHEEGVSLYGAPTYLEESEKTYAQWAPFIERGKKIENQIMPLITLFQKEDSSDVQFSQALEEIGKSIPEIDLEKAKSYVLKELGKSKLRFDLYRICDQTKQIQTQLKHWIADHPLRTMEAYREEFTKIQNEEYVRYKDLNLLKAWIEDHCLSANKKIVELESYLQFSERLTPWLDRHYQSRYLTPNELVIRIERINQEIKEATKAFKKIEASFLEMSTPDHYAAFNTDLAEFKEKTLDPLRKLITQTGQTSRAADFFKDLSFRVITEPFVVPSLPKDPQRRRQLGKLERRQLEELNLDKMLKHIDQKIVTTARTRAYALHIPMYLLLPVEAILAIYFTSPWMFWSLSIVRMMGGGISLYVDHRLEEMGKEKEAIKHEYHLRDHPEIGVIPGNRPELATVKEVQQKYGLEGSRRKRGRIMAQVSQAFSIPSTLEEGKELMKKLAEEGRQLATQNLKTKHILLEEDYAKLKPKSKEAVALKVRSTSIEEALDYQSASVEIPRQEKSKAEMFTMALRKADERRVHLAAERIAYERRLEDYRETLRTYRYLERIEKKYSAYSEEAIQKLPREKRIRLNYQMFRLQEMRECADYRSAKYMSSQKKDFKTKIEILKKEYQRAERACAKLRRRLPQEPPKRAQVEECLADVLRNFEQDLNEKDLTLDQAKEQREIFWIKQHDRLRLLYQKMSPFEQKIV